MNQRKESKKHDRDTENERRNSMKRLIAITGAMFLATAVFIVVASAGGDPVEKPVQGMWAGIAYSLGPCPDTVNFPSGAFLVVNVGHGTLTHMGNANFISFYCESFTTSTLLEGSGWTIVTGADGDTLHMSIEITNDLGVIPPRWEEHETIVGGTGKFEGATGEADSGGTVISGADSFPFGESYTPGLLSEPTYWIGATTDGWIRY
jgi:hypothetical protein